jgi:hypothetical protein
VVGPQPQGNAAYFETIANNEDRGDIWIRGLWARGRDGILDVRIAHVDAKSSRSQDPARGLAAQEREKKEEIPRGLPRAITSALFSVCGIYRGRSPR